jgi:protein-tyrosine phosphatase
MQSVSSQFGSLKLVRGCLFLAIDPSSASHLCIRKLQSDCVPLHAAKYQLERDLNCFHCSIIYAAEFQTPHVALEIENFLSDSTKSASHPAISPKKTGAAPEVSSSTVSFDILGIGSNSGCWFAVLSVPTGDLIRNICKLCVKQFHITLGFASRDDHSINKDSSVINHWFDDASLVRAAALMNISKPVSSKASRELSFILHHMENSSSSYKDITTVKMRLIKALINSGRIIEAQASICSVIDDAANVFDADAMIDALSIQYIMTMGCCLKPQREALADVFECLNSHKAIISGKCIKADANQRKLLKDLCEFVVCSPQEHGLRHVWHIICNNTLCQASLPLNFALQCANNLAGSGEPSTSSIVGVYAGGFESVITLTERDLPPEVKAAAPHIRYLHFPINDRHAPASLIELLKITDAVQHADAPVLVHCLGGKGRTALVLAAVLMIRHAKTTGVPYSSSEAIAIVKDRRSVILSAEQVHMLSELYGHLNSLEWTRPTFPAPRIMCVGLPCCGKSTFISQMIRAFGGQNVLIASQDEMGHDECERFWARNPRSGSVCVLDRCNVTTAERKLWLDICHRSSTACVFFNIDPAVCICRSAGRLVHPTLPSSRAPRIIEELARQLQAPLLSEGFCQIDEIRSEQDLHELIQRYGARESEDQILYNDDVVPFPRTPHLINLGAATEDDDVIFKKSGKKDLDTAIDARLKHAFIIGSQIVIEEKVDGANLAFRLLSNGSIAVQNRSHFVTAQSGEQFKRLDSWVEKHSAQLLALLKSPRWILYGCDECD